MDDKIKRQKLYEREEFTEEERKEILSKTNGVCAHCGKKLRDGTNLTVDHFIPISKGGINRMINCVPMCMDCNKNKSNLIYEPKDYLEYLNEDDLIALEGYFDSYISSFDFVNRDNLLACDRYILNICPQSVYRNKEHIYKKVKSRKEHDKLITMTSVQYLVKRALPEDEDKLVKYFIKYLKKYDYYSDDETVRANIEFWMHFGCIYYVERGDEVKGFITCTVTKATDNIVLTDRTKDDDEDIVNNYITINVFFLYGNAQSYSLAYYVSRGIPSHILKEQGLCQLPVKYGFVAKDKYTGAALCGNKRRDFVSKNEFQSFFNILCNDKNIEKTKQNYPRIQDDEALKKFFAKFKEFNQEKFNTWSSINLYTSNKTDWMIEELALPSHKEE